MATADAPRLRVAPPDEPFNIALLEPEIPQNTGSIARLCAATSSPLHLIGPLGFRIDEKAVRRAGLDYWHLVAVNRHLDMPHFSQKLAPERWLLFSATASQSYLDAPYAPGQALVFGKESVGLPEDLLSTHAGRVYGIPTSGPVRSIILATAVAVVLFEALRATGALADAKPR